jgi:DNA-directed RNA polymerase specialized sigma54-like protein
MLSGNGKHTLLAHAEIVAFQKDYFRRGMNHFLKPMILKELREDRL